MASRPYTQSFIRAGGAGRQMDYTVPQGFRIVARSIMAYSYAANDSASLYLHGVLVWRFRAPAAETSRSEVMTAVLYGGQVLTVVTAGVDVGVSVAGYIFADELGPIGAMLETDPPSPESFPLPPEPVTPEPR